MSNQKKKLSVALNQAVEPLIKEYANIIRIKESKDYQLYLTDADPASDFHFGISKETSDRGGHYIHFSCKPQNNQTNAALATSGSLDTFLQYLKIWLSNMKYYDQDSILDDPILRGYEQEYFNDFKIVDENADCSAFNYEQQLLLDHFLGKISDNIDSFKNESNTYLIDNIREEAQSIQSSITTETKNVIMKRITKLFAKSQKAGLKISNYILKEFFKEVCTKGIDWAFNYAIANGEKIPGYIHHITTHLLSN
jgi:hypothetical protein